MREEFWKKLKIVDQRSFKWFFDNYVVDKKIDLAYNTIYQQVKGDILTTLHPNLKKAMEAYLTN